ncbi:MAG: hypothetical protein KDB00_19700 [Planctomycetales bacterium]|nr:hypothetical protein [Planctomycetales bacterium]
MAASDQKIAALLRNLAAGQFDEVSDWDTCYQLVVQVISRRNLPASQYAPESRFGGAEWTDDDFLAIAGEWCAVMLDYGAAGIVGQGRTDRHIANTAKKSIRDFVHDRVKGYPKNDLWKSLKEALNDFESLLNGETIREPRIPDSRFPIQEKEKNSRQRCFSVPEVRDALAIIAQVFPTGWTKLSLFECLVEWTGVGDGKDTSLDVHDEEEGSASSRLADEHRNSNVNSFLMGEADAANLLDRYPETERRIIRGYVIPNKLGLVTLVEASDKLGIPRSTLSDQGNRLWKQLELAEFEETADRDTEWRRGFFSRLLDDSFGNPFADLSTDSLENEQ